MKDQTYTPVGVALYSGFHSFGYGDRPRLYCRRLAVVRGDADGVTYYTSHPSEGCLNWWIEGEGIPELCRVPGAADHNPYRLRLIGVLPVHPEKYGLADRPINGGRAYREAFAMALVRCSGVGAMEARRRGMQSDEAFDHIPQH